MKTKGDKMTIEDVINKSESLYKEGKFYDCLILNKQYADITGDDRLQYNCGSLYYRHISMPHEAIKYFKKSVAQQNILAIICLTHIYCEDKYWQDINLAKHIIHLSHNLPSAKKYSPQINYLYGKIYENEKEYIKSLLYYELSADEGLDLSQFILGKFYFEGKHINKDYLLAAKWFRKASQQGDDVSKFYLARILSNLIGDENVKKIEDLDEAIKLIESISKKTELEMGLLSMMLYYKAYNILSNLSHGNKFAEDAKEKLYPFYKKTLTENTDDNFLDIPIKNRLENEEKRSIELNFPLIGTLFSFGVI